MRFHLLHVLTPKGHGLMGYKEVIDSVAWGFKALGHEVSYAVNAPAPGARNIVFGAQVMEPTALAALPADTIIYNFEQLRGHTPDKLRPSLRMAAERFQIWDYSEFNMATWAGAATKSAAVHVPVGYAPALERIARPAEQDIDVLIYGMPNDLRLAAFQAIAQTGLSTVFLCGLYGEARDALIGRSKLVLNATLYTTMRVFEVVRVSYLWANRKAVLALLDADTAMEAGVRDAIIGVGPREMRRVAEEYCADGEKRRAVEEAGHAFFVQRDIRPILERALEASR